MNIIAYFLLLGEQKQERNFVFNFCYPYGIINLVRGKEKLQASVLLIYKSWNELIDKSDGNLSRARCGNPQYRSCMKPDMIDFIHWSHCGRFSSLGFKKRPW